MSQQQANENHRVWMRTALQKAAETFALTITGSPVFGWRDRSIGAHARAASGERWLRVVTEQRYWSGGEFWTGNVDASVIDGVTKPRVLAVYEWQEGPQALPSEVMTLLAGVTCSPTPEMRTSLSLASSWWGRLRRSIDNLADVSTQRIAVDQQTVDRRLTVFFGDTVNATVDRWTTAHGDLHWANLTRPDCALLDWEGWGIAPAGYDAAILYCYSLLLPCMARQVYDTFADVLDTPSGVRAQLYAITRLLLRVEYGDHPDLAVPLHYRAAALTRHSTL